MSKLNPTEKHQQWVDENPEKVAAHKAVHAAIRVGELVEPDPPACEWCGDITRLDAHHDDYAFPLTVEWICHHCHYWEHEGVRPAPPRKRRMPEPRPRYHKLKKQEMESKRKKRSAGDPLRKAKLKALHKHRVRVASPSRYYHMCEAMALWPGRPGTTYPCKLASEQGEVFCKKHRNWQGDVKEK